MVCLAIDLYASGKIDRTAYAERCRREDDKLSKTKIERTEIMRRIPALHKQDVIHASIRRYCESLRSAFDLCDGDDDRRRFVKDYITKIIYDRKHVTLLGSIPIKLPVKESTDQALEANLIPFKVESWIKHRRPH